MTRWLLDALLLVALAVGAWFGWSLLHERDAARERARAVEEELLEADGIAVSHQVDAEIAKADASRLASESAALRDEVERLRKAAPSARVVGVESGGTGPLAVIPNSVIGIPNSDSADSCPVPSNARLAIRFREVEMQTRAGNLALSASAQVVRLWPLPETMIAEGPIQFEIAEHVEPLPSPVAPWWHYALAGGVGLLAGLVGGVALAH